MVDGDRGRVEEVALSKKITLLETFLDVEMMTINSL